MLDAPLDRVRRRRTGLIGWAAGLVVVGVLGGWALRTILAPASDVLDAPGYTLVTAQQDTIGQTLRLNTSAQWLPASVAPNQSVGIVTTIDLAGGSSATPGTVLYTVELRPVVVATGDVPAFRDLSISARGKDVSQLQAMLASLGRYRGKVDGIFSAELSSAVRAWQRQLGVTADGVVRRGDVVFVPRLPVRLALDAKVRVGAVLAGGEPVVQVLPATPQFTITLPDGQAQLVDVGMAVQIPRGGTAWRAEITEVRQGQTETGASVAALRAPGNASICGQDCSSIPLGGPTLLPSLIQVVPEVSGITVPAAALVTTASGEVGVVLANGEFRVVKVLASASGTAVVEGVTSGEQVRTPGKPGTALGIRPGTTR